VSRPNPSRGGRTPDLDTVCRPFDPAAVVVEDRRPFPDRPWVLANFVAALDGAATGPDEKSGSLSGPADRRMFQALRAAADPVLAGAGTVRAENYGPARLTDEQQELRRAQGRTPLPLLAVVSASLRLDPQARFFAAAPADRRPLVLTTEAARAHAEDRAAAIAEVATIVEAGETTVDWGLALRRLHDEHAVDVLLTEGGPTVVGQLVTADLLDEMCLTVAPLLAGGDGPRIVAGARITQALPQSLARVMTTDDFLFLRYLRVRASGT
jgi:riboflavin-specific deaminase-like protein